MFKSYSVTTLFIALLVIVSFTSKAQTLKVGLIADCQYCNCDYSERWNNDYRQGIPRLIEAVDTFNQRNVDLTFHLGDFIDRDFKSFNEVSPLFEQLTMPHYHVLGNHDFSVADSLKKTVPTILGLEKLSYYTIHKNNWVFIVLDGTDISLYKTNDTTQIKEAEKIRKHYENLGRIQSKPWNGAVSEQQLVWLESQLRLADKTDKNVILFCHFPILPKGDANLWNDTELITLIEQYSSVKAFINGHHHPGNYMVHKGVHYLTLQGMVRTKKQNSFAIISLENNKIVVQGFGREPNRVLNF